MYASMSHEKYAHDVAIFCKIRILTFSIDLKFVGNLGSVVCQISERNDHYDIQSRGFQTLRVLTVKTSYHKVNRGPTTESDVWMD